MDSKPLWYFQIAIPFYDSLIQMEHSSPLSFRERYVTSQEWNYFIREWTNGLRPICMSVEYKCVPLVHSSSPFIHVVFVCCHQTLTCKTRAIDIPVISFVTLNERLVRFISSHTLVPNYNFNEYAFFISDSGRLEEGFCDSIMWMCGNCYTFYCRLRFTPCLASPRLRGEQNALKFRVKVPNAPKMSKQSFRI